MKLKQSPVFFIFKVEDLETNHPVIETKSGYWTSISLWLHNIALQSLWLHNMTLQSLWLHNLYGYTIWLYNLYGYTISMATQSIWLHNIYGYTISMVTQYLWLHNLYGYTISMTTQSLWLQSPCVHTLYDYTISTVTQGHFSLSLHYQVKDCAPRGLCNSKDQWRLPLNLWCRCFYHIQHGRCILIYA